MIDSLEPVEPSVIDLSASAVRVGDACDCDDETRAGLEEKLGPDRTV